MNIKKRLSPLLIFAGTINFILFFIKFYIGIRTNSQCIYTDSINNLMDTLSLCLALIGVAFINKPATDKFKYGFGKAEDLTAFIMSLLMTATGLGFAYSSLGRLMTPTPVWYFTKYAIIVGTTCLIKLVLGIVFYIRYKKDKSAVLKTVMLDSFLDCGITAVTIISFTLSNTLGYGFDALLGLVISIVIAVSGIKLIISSTSGLLGKKNEEIESKILETINEICKDKPFNVKNVEIHTYGKEKVFATIYMTSNFCNSDIMEVQNIIKIRLNNDLNVNSAVDWEVFS